MSLKINYERLVKKLMTRYMELYPMASWIGPEEAVDYIVNELLVWRGDEYAQHDMLLMRRRSRGDVRGPVAEAAQPGTHDGLAVDTRG